MDSIQERLNQAQQCCRSQPAQAADLLQGILREQPTNCQALELLAKLSFQQQKHDVALDLLRRALYALDARPLPMRLRIMRMLFLQPRHSRLLSARLSWLTQTLGKQARLSGTHR